MSISRRHLLLSVSLVLTLSASAWTHWQEQSNDEAGTVAGAVERPGTAHSTQEGTSGGAGTPVSVTTPSRSTDPDASATPFLALERLERQRHPDSAAEEGSNGGMPSGVDPFRPKSWYVAPPAPPPPPPPKPTAPPLPFQFMGLKDYADGTGKVRVYLTRGSEVFTVSPGDTFDTHYRFEKIEQGNLVIQYLPLSTLQRLPLGQP